MTKKNDYTLNGTINATTWQEFRAVMKEAGIDTATKTYAQLVEEYNALTKECEAITPNQIQGLYIIQRICRVCFVATYGDSVGERVITQNKLFGIIRFTFTNDELLPEDKIKSVVNYLVEKEYITVKEYESGATIYYCTDKAFKLYKEKGFNEENLERDKTLVEKLNKYKIKGLSKEGK